jgi:hypothetical protein
VEGSSGVGCNLPEGEPSLAAPEQMNQARAWAHPGNRQELEEQCEGEGSESDRDC